MTNKEKEEFQKLQAELEQSRGELESLKGQNVLMVDDCTQRRQELETLLVEKQVLSERIQQLEADNAALKAELEKEKAARSQVLEANGNLRAAIATQSPEQLAAHVRAQIIV